MAHALSLRGQTVLVLEKGGAPATGASGNALAVLFPQLTKQWTPLSRFSLMAYAYMQRQLTHWQHEGRHDLFIQPGMIQLPRSEADILKFENLHETLALSHEVVAPMSRSTISQAMPSYTGSEDGLYFPHGAAIDGAKVCQYYMQQDTINTHFQSDVTRLAQEETGWRVTLASGDDIAAKNLVLCNATNLLNFEKTSHYPLSWNRGQLTIVPSGAVTHPLHHILCHKGYILPLPTGDYLIGATYDRDYHTCDLRSEDHEENLTAVRDMFPDWLKSDVSADRVKGRASNRSVSKDRTPLIGQAIDADGIPLKGLYLSAGHGSRGFLTAPLGAEYLANLITAAPSRGLPEDIVTALSPARFCKK